MLQAIRREQQCRFLFFAVLFKFFLHVIAVFLGSFQHFPDKGRGPRPVDPGVLRRFGIVEPGNLLPGERDVMDRPVFHIRRGYNVIFFTAEYILPVVEASVDVELPVRHHMRLAVRYVIF